MPLIFTTWPRAITLRSVQGKKFFACFQRMRLPPCMHGLKLPAHCVRRWLRIHGEHHLLGLDVSNSFPHFLSIQAVGSCQLRATTLERNRHIRWKPLNLCLLNALLRLSELILSWLSPLSFFECLRPTLHTCHHAHRRSPFNDTLWCLPLIRCYSESLRILPHESHGCFS